MKLLQTTLLVFLADYILCLVIKVTVQKHFCVNKIVLIRASIDSRKNTSNVVTQKNYVVELTAVIIRTKCIQRNQALVVAGFEKKILLLAMPLVE